jgi:predicted metalloprotease
VKRTFTSVIALGLASSLAVACAQPAEDTLLTSGAPNGGPSAPNSSDDPAAVADRAVADVTSYWDQTYPDVYGDSFEPVAGFYPYGPDTEPPPCGSPPPRYEEIADNAFYCPGDDIIAWDEYALMPALNEEFGAFTVAIVIAHEFGHAIQDRFGTSDRTVDLELQADCFAGSWTARVADGDAQGFEPGDVDLDKTVAGMIAIRDVPGTSPDDPFAHGSGFDRVSAFQDGYENGADKCAEYADENVDRTTAEIEFDTESGEINTGGNLDLEGENGVYALVEADLNEFYGWLFGELGATSWTPIDDLVVVDPSVDEVTCGGDTLEGDDLRYAAVYCEDENIAVIDGTDLADDLYEYGDFAVASELGQIWAVAAQAQLGAEGDEADLQADCLTGLWAASTFPGVEDVTPESGLTISAGDLDEGIQGFIAYGAGTGDQTRTVFDRTGALRTGVFDGIGGCEEYGPLG